MRTLFISIVFLLCASELWAQKSNIIKDFQLAFDSTRKAKFYSQELRVGLVIYPRKGRVRKTSGWLKGDQKWKYWNVNVSPGKFKNGVIYYTAQELHEHNYQVKVSVTPQNNPEFIKEFQVDVPHINALTISFDRTKTYSPFDTVPLSAIAQYSHGKKYPITKDFENLPITFKKLLDHNYSEFTNSNIIIPMPLMPETIYDTCYVRVQHRFDSNIQQTIGIPVYYYGDYTLNFSGDDGFHGKGGYNGSLEQDATSGDNGENGQGAEDVTIFIRSIQRQSKVYLYIKAISARYEDIVVIDPDKGNVLIQANGGHGGNGGFGGHSGRDNTQGYGGNGGHGGDGGNAGAFQVYADTTAQIYLRTCFTFENKAGKAGVGGEGGNIGTGNSPQSKKPGKNGMDGKPGKDALPLKIQVVDPNQLDEMIRKQ